MSDRFEMTVAADGGAVAALQAEVEAFAAAAALSPKAEHLLSLVVEELVTNVVNYGFADRVPGQVSLGLDRVEGALVGELVDDGRPFNPADAPDPDLDASIEDRRVGGLGVHLVMTLTEDFAYERAGARNVVRFRIRV
jgi:serine/threonine-protein kinase RsbW